MGKRKWWTTRDWVWLTGILLVINIFTLAFRLGNNLEVINLFSFISSSVSIALALIAIFIALKQDSDNKRVSDETSRILADIVNIVNNVHENVKKIDEKVLQGVTQDVVDTFADLEGSQETYTKAEMKELLNSFGKELTNEVINTVQSEGVNLNKDNSHSFTPPIFSRDRELLIKLKIKDIRKKNPSIDIKGIQNELEGYGFSVTLASISRIIKEFNL